MAMTDELKLEHLDAAGARRIATEVIVPVYEASHADDVDDPFHSTERFVERLVAYTQRDGFELVVAYTDDSVPIGLAFGYAELLSRWPELRATLLAEPDNAPAQAAYAQWGWRKVAKLKPFPDAPVYDALILPLAPE
jgi:hypothetical protein